MEFIAYYLLLFLGLAVLILGGEFLVRGAVGLALKAHISTLVIGMTVVSFGTSAPELLISMNAALKGGEDAYMSIGNVIGSNIANLALVLGITSLVYPIKVQRDSIVQDWPVMFGATLLFYWFMWDSKISHWEGGILFVLIIAFTIFLLKKSRQSSHAGESQEEEQQKPKPVWVNLTFLVLGCVALVFGSEWLLSSASKIATEHWKVEPYIVSVTVIAFGTSVPELATSAIAAYRKETDIAVGNLIGSNIFNILCVVGLTGAVAEMPLKDDIINFHGLWMIGIALVLFPLMLFKRKIGRLSGVFLVLLYAVYTYFVFP